MSGGCPPRLLAPDIGQRDLELEVAHCVRGLLSPLLANAVLHRLDRAWQERHRRLGVLIRYADDEVICCPTQERAEAALAALGDILAGPGLTLSASKTRIVCVAGGEEGYDFLGFHHRMVPARRNLNRRCWRRRNGRVTRRWPRPAPASRS